MTDDPQQHQRIDVAAGDHHGHRGLEVLRTGEHRGRCSRPGRLDHQLGALEQEHHRSRDLVLGHRGDLVDVALDDGERHVAGAADSDAVGHRGHRGESDGLASRERCRVGRRGRGLHPDHAHGRVDRLHGEGDAGKESATAGADDDRAHLGQLAP